MRRSQATFILAAVSVVLNVLLGAIIYKLHWPIYLDSIGIMLTAILVSGSRYVAFAIAVMVAVVSYLIIGLYNPFQLWFIFSGISGAAFGALVVRGRIDAELALQSTFTAFIGKVLMFGVGWGIVAAILSEPIVVYLFGGVTANATTTILVALHKAGLPLHVAALITGLIAESIDKTLQLLCAISIAILLPSSFKAMIRKPLKQSHMKQSHMTH